MSAPPVLRPLRAILQRRLQIVPSRPIRSPYYSRASQSCFQLRYNSSIPPDQTPKPNQEQSKEEATDGQVTQNASPVEEAQNVKEVPSQTAEDLTTEKAKTEAEQAPAVLVTNFDISRNETGATTTEVPVLRLDGLFLKSAFQKVRSVDAEIQAGIEEAVTRQLKKAESQKATAEETFVADDTITAIPEPSIQEIAEAVFSEASETVISESQGQEASAPTPAVVLETAIPEATKEVILEASESEDTASDVVSPEAVASKTESVEPLGHTAKPQESPAASPLETPVSTSTQSSESQATAPESITTVSDILDDIEAQAETAKSAEPLGDVQVPQTESIKESPGSSLDDKLTKPADKATKKTEKKVNKGKEGEKALDEDEDDGPELSRMPRNVQALYLQPLRRVAKYGVPSCDLQLRSYSVRPLESFCDFALRAAYYLGLPAYGPTPLPKIIERWTVPKASFIFKKSQENFERITRRRLIQIRDGHPETVQLWLAFLQKHQQAAVGMKANMWEFSSLDVAKELDKAIEEAQPGLEKSFKSLGQSKTVETVEKVDEILTSERYKLAGGR